VSARDADYDAASAALEALGYPAKVSSTHLDTLGRPAVDVTLTARVEAVGESLRHAWAVSAARLRERDDALREVMRLQQVIADLRKRKGG